MGIAESRIKPIIKEIIIEKEILNRIGKVWIDLGCGENKRKGCIGVDKRNTSSTDIVADISKRIPFESNSVDEVYAISVLEHFENPYLVIEEIHRILKPNGRLTVTVPNIGTYNAHLEAQAKEGHKYLADWQLWKVMLEGYFKKIKYKTHHIKYRSSPYILTRAFLYVTQKLLILLGFYDFARDFTFICRYKKENPKRNYKLYWWKD